jgi:hypothetical protein
MGQGRCWRSGPALVPGPAAPATGIRAHTGLQRRGWACFPLRARPDVRRWPESWASRNPSGQRNDLEYVVRALVPLRWAVRFGI